MGMTATDRDTEFTGFVVSCAPSLRHTAYLLTGDRHAAEDLLQDALTKTWLAWNRIDGAGDGTRDRWKVTRSPDGLAVVLVAEVYEGGDWIPHALGTEEHLLFRHAGHAVAMATGRADADGVSMEQLREELDDAVEALLRR